MLTAHAHFVQRMMLNKLFLNSVLPLIQGPGPLHTINKAM